MVIPAKNEGSWEKFRLSKFTHKLHAMRFIRMHEIETWLNELGKSSNSN